MAVVV